MSETASENAKASNPWAPTPQEDHALDRLLNELRVIIPGVQLLFAFLLTVPFDQRFRELTPFQRTLFGVDLMSTAISCLFLIAPSVYHRVHHRRDEADAQTILTIFNRFAIIGGAALGVAINGSIFLILDFIFGLAWALGCTIPSVGLCVALWFALPLYRRGSLPSILLKDVPKT